MRLTMTSRELSTLPAPQIGGTDHQAGKDQQHKAGHDRRTQHLAVRRAKGLGHLL